MDVYGCNGCLWFYDLRMKIENATLKESMECMDHLISSIHRLHLALLKVNVSSSYVHDSFFKHGYAAFLAQEWISSVGCYSNINTVRNDDAVENFLFFFAAPTLLFRSCNIIIILI